MADDDEWDLTDELLEMGSVGHVAREPVPHAEQTRRGLLIGASVVLILTTIMNVAFALVLSGPQYAVTGPALGLLMAAASAVLGNASNFYFTHRR